MHYRAFLIVCCFLLLGDIAKAQDAPLTDCDSYAASDFDPHQDCASGGIRAISAFKTLCPSYGGEIELKD